MAIRLNPIPIPALRQEPYPRKEKCHRARKSGISRGLEALLVQTSSDFVHGGRVSGTIWYRLARFLASVPVEHNIRGTAVVDQRFPITTDRGFSDD